MPLSYKRSEVERTKGRAKILACFRDGCDSGKEKKIHGRDTRERKKGRSRGARKKWSLRKGRRAEKISRTTQPFLSPSFQYKLRPRN